MKHFFSNLTMVAILVTTVIFTSCQKEEVTSPSETGKLSFGFNLKTQVLNKGMEGPQLKTTSNINPVAVIANLVDENGKVVLKNKRITLHKKDGVYTSQPQELEQGNYTLTDYCLVDADSVIVGVISKSGSPLDLVVTKGEAVKFTPEVLSTKVKPTSSSRLKSGTGYGMVTMEVDYNSLEVPNMSVRLVCNPEADNVYIFWGDGTAPQVLAIGSYNKHNYSADGKYSIVLYGDIENILQLYAVNNNITSFNISNAHNLNSLELGKNKLNNINVSDLPALKVLNVEGNNLSNLDINNNLSLEVVTVGHNKLSNLDIGNNIALLMVSASFNELTSFDISNNPKIGLVNLSYNYSLLSFKASNNRDMLWLNLGYNKLTSLDCSEFPNLQELSCYNNELTTLDLRENKRLEELRCDVNNLINLDVTENVGLTTLSCGNNNLTSLNLANNTLLNGLYIVNNKDMESIDISTNTDLFWLWVSGTKITNVDISNNKKLAKVHWVSNILQSDDINNLYTQFFIHASVNNIRGGVLHTSNTEPTSPVAIQFKKSLVDIYNWTIKQE